MRVSMIVPNPCAPDFRVMKEAESLAAAGHEVCVFCVAMPGLPQDEVRAGVRYQRLEWKGASPRQALEQLFRRRIQAPAATQPGAPTSAPSVAPPNPTPNSGRLAKILGAERAAVIRAWLRDQSQTLHQPWLAASFGRSFEAALTASRADVIHAHDLPALPVASRVAMNTGAAFIFDSHELETHRNPPLSPARRRQVERLEARLLPRAAAVITVGDSIADHLATHYGIPRPLVLYNTPRAADQSPRSDQDPGLRMRAGLPEDSFLLVYTGNVAINRGLETVVAALGQLRQNAPEHGFGRPVCLVTVGRSPPSVAARLSRLAQEAGVLDRLAMLPPVPPEDVSRVIASADAAIIPIIPVALSYQYAMPNKLFEALMAGLPVIGSDLAEMGPFLRDRQLGLTFPAGDASALAETILTMARATPGTFRKLAAESIGWEAQAERLVEFYHQLGQERCD
ncbi:Glycosyltransferase involved in cell wall bisynthesis [Rhodobacter sp. 24-YEA-8]|nr:Glycosyltransferase involved in cell wall bisynthesis [Rhodobacter sp. 24-YEA-8]